MPSLRLTMSLPVRLALQALSRVYILLVLLWMAKGVGHN